MADEGLIKYLKPGNYLQFVAERFLPPNIRTNRHAHSLDSGQLDVIKNVTIRTVDASGVEYEQWVNKILPDWNRKWAHIRHKKLLEFFFSCKILDPQEGDVFLDIASGIDSYVPNLPVGRKILHDQKSTDYLRSLFGDEVEYLSSDAAAIDMPPESVDHISLHHAFEHFEGDSDIRCVREAQRLLRKGGRCCIMPIFLATEYIELTKLIDFSKKYGSRSTRIIDPTFRSTYTRLYDAQAFEERIVNSVDLGSFELSVVQLKLDGKPIPDMDLPVHSRACQYNYPYRALVIERR